MEKLKKDEVSLHSEEDQTVITPFNFQIAIYLLNKVNKKAEEIIFLKKLLKAIPIFKNHDYLFCLQGGFDHVLNSIKLDYFPLKSVIFNYGTLGYKLYIILRGEISLFVPQREIDV